MIDPSEIEFSAKITDDFNSDTITVEVTAVVVHRISISRHQVPSKGEAIQVATDRLKHHFEYEVFR